MPTVRLRLRKPKSNKKVQWTQGTVDNEHLNKKKSKCMYLIFFIQLFRFMEQRLYTFFYIQVVVFMRNQKRSVKVVLKIVMMNASIAMDIRMLIKKSYLILEILHEKECHHILVRIY